MAPLVVVGRAGTPGRSRSSRGSRRRATAKPSATSSCLNGRNDAEGLRRSGRRAGRRRRDARAAALAGRRRRAPQVALDPQAVAGREGDPLGRRDAAGRQGRRGGRPGSESVTWRGRASSGATPGTGSSHRSCGGVSRSPIAATQAPSASQPTARQTPSHGLIRLPAGRPPRSAASSAAVRGRASGAAVGRARRRARSWKPSWTSMWTNRLPSGEGSGALPTPPPRLAVLAFAGGQDDPVAAVGGQPDDLEPAVGVGRRTGASRRAASGAPTSHARRRRRRPGSSPVATSTMRDLRTSTGVGSVVPGHDGEPRRRRAPSRTTSTSTPVAVRAVGRGGFGSRGRPAAARDRGVDHPDLRPAAAARQEGEAPAVGRPARGAAAARLGRRPGSEREPSASTTQISSSRTNARRRPSGDHCGSETGFSEAVSWVG